MEVKKKSRQVSKIEPRKIGSEGSDKEDLSETIKIK